MSHPLYIVDVFAREKYAGNQLAVVADAADLSDGEMGKIAAEMAYSETAFVERVRPGGPHEVRIFTPEEEIPFAGHPTLGTAHVLREHLADDPGEPVGLNLGVGEIPVRVTETDGRETLWMTQQPPEFGDLLDRKRLARVLSLSRDDLDPDWPVRGVSTGLPTAIVPLADRDALGRAGIDREAYDRFVANHDEKNVLAFCPEPREPDNDLAVRVFAPFYGVPEDPATGSSNGCLAAYLARHEYFGDDAVSVRVEQGHGMGRPSLLHLRAADREDAVEVEVGGSVVDIAEGRLV